MKHRALFSASRRMRLCAAGLLVLTGGFCLITDPFGAPRVYLDTDIPFVYRPHVSTPAQYLPHIDAGHLSWNNVVSSYWQFSRGDATSVSAPGYDGVNLLFFDFQGVNFPVGTGIIAFSQTWSSSSGVFHALESDLIWNARDFPPAPGGGGGQQDLESVIVHEFGHHLGLDHTGLPSGASSGCGPMVQAATMWAFSNAGDTTKRSLHPEDAMGVSVLYPSWRLQGSVTDVQGAPLEAVPIAFSGAKVSLVGPVENPAGTGYNRAGYLLDTVRTDLNGSYATIPLGPDLDAVIDLFGWDRDSARVHFDPPGGVGQTQIITLPFVLHQTPLAAFTGVVRDAVTQNPVQASLEFFGIGDPDGQGYTVVTQPDGSFSAALRSREFYRIVIRPAAPYADALEIPRVYHHDAGTVQNVDLEEAGLLLVDDDAGQPYQTSYQASLRRLGIRMRTFSVADSGSTPASVLALFSRRPPLLWFTGSDSTGALAPAERALLAGHLRAGGLLLLTGQNLAQFSPAGDSLLEGMLGVRYGGPGPGAFIRGFAGDVIGSGVNYLLTGGQAPQNSKDILALAPGSEGSPVPSVYYVGSPVDTTQHAVVRVAGPGSAWAAAVFGFGLEGIAPARQDTFILRSLRFFAQTVTGVGGASPPELPEGFALEQNYPNPFNPATQISYRVPERSRVRIEVFDVVGRRVALLLDAERPAGSHSLEWNPRLSGGAASGVYLLRMQAATPGGVRYDGMRKIVLLR
ncbi:MAG: hypothetical protein WB626_10395 [Bacteroidota bacterium]